jgi:hypothetical protein
VQYTSDGREVCFSQQVRDTFAKLTQIDQNNYPETLGATIILNAGWVFSSVFKVIATFLDQHTREKIQMLGSSKKDLAVLQSFLDLDQIPACIGGNLPYDPPLPCLLLSCICPSCLSSALSRPSCHSKLCWASSCPCAPK